MASGMPGQPRRWTADAQSDRAFLSASDGPSQRGPAGCGSVGLRACFVFLEDFVVFGYGQSPGALHHTVHQVLLGGKLEQK